MTTQAELPLVTRHVYRAKRPARVGLSGYYNDRQIIWLDAARVQYDSPTVRQGAKYPTVTREKFAAWAGSDVTVGYPSDDWEVWA